MSVENDPSGELAQYVHPEKLVTTEWLAAHLDDPDIVIVESDEDVLLYDTGHIAGPWSTSVPRRSSEASARTCPSTPRRGYSAAGTSPGRPASPGSGRPTTTGRSSRSPT